MLEQAPPRRSSAQPHPKWPPFDQKPDIREHQNGASQREKDDEADNECAEVPSEPQWAVEDNRERGSK
jgi:hypothetical protein